MIFSYEFILNKPIDLCIGTFFETSLYQNGEYVKRSFGSDNFHVNTKLLRGKRLSALGRNCVIQLPFEELPTKVQVQKPSQVKLPTTSNLEILCKTNIFLSKEYLCDFLVIKIQVDDHYIDIPLTNFSDNITLIDYGRYLINLSSIIINKNMKKSAQ